jgi:dTDP-4-dehydrorhamnose reductase
MRVLILGGDGMLGHQLLLELQKGHQAAATLREDAVKYRSWSMFTSANSIANVEAGDLNRLREVISLFRPDAVVNAIGVVKQGPHSADVIQNLEINALLPHRLAELCAAAGARLVHISTDCVFSGARGGYTEEDVADATDLYGRTKLLGEVTGAGCITLRTSIIGLELKRRKSLIEWFVAERGTISGYTRAIYSGLTTMELSRVIRRLLEEFPNVSGLHHVVATPISKYDILRTLATLLGRTDITIKRDEQFVCDRSMRGDKFEQATGYRAPPWPALLSELSDHIKRRAA